MVSAGQECGGSPARPGACPRRTVLRYHRWVFSRAVLDSAQHRRGMAKHYVYRMDHDTGFAPRVSKGTCTLCGCKTTTVEAWANPGSWIIGIGGKGTGRPDALIYALKV